MRSPSASDTLKGLLICLALLVPALFVINVLNSHAKEHGHCVPFPMLDMELPVRDQGDAAKGQEGGGRHGCFIARGSLSTPLNKVERP